MPVDLASEFERLADRLRVVGPRLGQRRTPEAEARLDDVRSGLQRLADLAADAEGQPRRDVPVLGPHALADQALVLGHDLLRAADEARLEAVRALVVDLRGRL